MLMSAGGVTYLSTYSNASHVKDHDTGNKHPELYVTGQIIPKAPAAESLSLSTNIRAKAPPVQPNDLATAALEQSRGAGLSDPSFPSPTSSQSQ